jgi:RNA recognition motif-containing protein
VNIFVGNLVWSTTEEELAQLFEAYGIVERVQLMLNRETGRSRGFGFVEMPNASEAQAAIEALYGITVGGRVLTMNEARQREDRDGRRRPRG